MSPSGTRSSSASALVISALILLAALVPSSARAVTSVSSVGGELSVIAGPGEANSVAVTVVRFTDGRTPAWQIYDVAAGHAAGPGCVYRPDLTGVVGAESVPDYPYIECPFGASRLTVQTGDLNDSLSFSFDPVETGRPVSTVEMGEGSDNAMLFYADTVFLGPGNDDFMSTGFKSPVWPDEVNGGRGDDSMGVATTLRGGPGDDELFGDRLASGGSGDDVLHDARTMFGGRGNDRLIGLASTPNRMDGGPGKDVCRGQLGFEPGALEPKERDLAAACERVSGARKR